MACIDCCVTSHSSARGLDTQSRTAGISALQQEYEGRDLVEASASYVYCVRVQADEGSTYACGNGVLMLVVFLSCM